MISFAAIQDRLLTKRTDKDAREHQMAYQIAVRRFAVISLSLQEVHTFTLTGGARVASTYAAVDEKEALFILKAEKETAPGVFESLFPLNARRLREHTLDISQGIGTLHSFVSDHGRFLPYQIPVADTQVRALIAYKPVGEFDEVDLPGEAEDAIVDGALAELMALPGRQRSAEMADMHSRAFKAAAEDALGVALIGDTQYARSTAAHPRSWVPGWSKLRW